MAVPQGGHDYEFVGEVPGRFICQICTKILLDPHLAVCCGQHFCESCLNKWFTRQGKESCPHCRTEGETFDHVIHKGLRSEVNQLKIRCSNHGEGCQWIGELGELKQHLKLDDGCGYVIVECPNKCNSWVSKHMRKTPPFSVPTAVLTTLKRKDLEVHITTHCYLRPYQCEFCGLKDTYKAIKGHGLYPVKPLRDNPYSGHQAKCPEAPLICRNRCGPQEIKRKDMESHCSQCPKEPVECPFAEVGCMKRLKRCECDTHVTSSQQEHLSLVMKDYRDTKKELHEVKGTLFTAVQLLKLGTEADKEMVDRVLSYLPRLARINDLVDVFMPKLSEYRRSGKVWHSPPFYYREGYKMCLAVHANGVGKGAGTHISITLIVLKEQYVNTLQQSECLTSGRHPRFPLIAGQRKFNVCRYQPLSQYSEAIKELSREETFCTHEYIISKLVNDCLTFCITYSDSCHLLVSVK